jgi:hypothetical protein
MQDALAWCMLNGILILRQRSFASNWTDLCVQNLRAFQCKVKFSVTISQYSLSTVWWCEGNWDIATRWRWVVLSPLCLLDVRLGGSRLNRWRRKKSLPLWGDVFIYILNLIVLALTPVPTSHIPSFQNFSATFLVFTVQPVFSILSSRSLYPDCFCSVSSIVIYFILYYATSRKVTSSFAGEVIGFFSWHKPSSRTMALGSTQSLTEMSIRNLPGGKRRPAGA